MYYTLPAAKQYYEHQTLYLSEHAQRTLLLKFHRYRNRVRHSTAAGLRLASSEAWGQRLRLHQPIADERRRPHSHGSADRAVGRADRLRGQTLNTAHGMACESI